jgi:hypothetical protein
MPLNIVEETVDVIHVEVTPRPVQRNFWHDQTELDWAHDVAIL